MGFGAVAVGDAAEPVDKSAVPWAQTRFAEMRTLMARDPAEFTRRAMPEAERARSPQALQPYLERRIKGRGSFGAYCILPLGETNRVAEAEGGHGGIAYEVRLNGAKYRAYVAGKWREQRTVREAEIEGVVLGDAIALSEAPTPDEQAAAGEMVLADAPVLSGPNTVLYIIAQFSDETNAPIDSTTALSQMGVVNTFWLNNSAGAVSIRGIVNAGQVMDVVNVTLPQPLSFASTYNGDFGRLLSDARSAAAVRGFNYLDYNLDVVVTTGQGFSYAGRAYISGQGAHLVKGYTSLRTAGHELGHNLGLYHANYWRTDCPHPYGKDSVPGGYVADTANAEWVEYGHYCSVMSAQTGGEMDDPAKPHYAPAEKVRLGWLSGAAVRYVSASGTHRLYRADHRDTTGTPRGLRIDIPAANYAGGTRYYWLGYRLAPWSTAQNWFRNGVQVDVLPSSYGSEGATMLDMTPFSKDANSPFFDPANRSGSYWTIDNLDKVDGALVLGRTYSDDTAGIHITPIATGNSGTNEEFIDVVVNLGTFSGNHAPVITAFGAGTNQAAVGQPVSFSVTASDPDGDSLAYAWDFDQVQTWTASGLNSPAATKSWPAAGQYRVTVTVSDMKGGVAADSVLVTVGAPTNSRQIWGRVVWGGRPVLGARVWTTAGSTSYQAWTDGDGAYVLTDLPATNAWTVQCAVAGLTFSDQFANPVTVATSYAYGKDFYANEPLPAGGGQQMFRIAGQVTDAGLGVANAEVRAAGMLAMTDVAGSFVISNLAAGSYLVAPWKDAWTFSPASRVVTLSTSDSTGNQFARSTPYSVRGRFTGIPDGNQDPAPMVYLSNGRSARATRQGTGQNRYFGYTLDNVPTGRFSIWAELAGYRLTPAGFTNPLNVAASLSGIDFSGVAGGTVGTISGRITELGLPLTGVSVAAKVGGNNVASAVTDSDGYYCLYNLTNASYTATPTAADYAFSPPAYSIGTLSTTGRNFVGTGSNTPPVIASVAASPAVVPVPGTPATLTAAASGRSPLSYGWSAVRAPAQVNFATNDAPGAASTVVLPEAAGSHLFRVRVTDALGFSAVSNVALTVNGGSGAMVVSPYEVTVGVGESVPFRADGWDELGNRQTLMPGWAVNGGGTMETNGVFTGVTPGGSYTVMATAGFQSATATVTVSTNIVTVPAPRLALVSLGTNRACTVRFSGVAGLTYRMEYSDQVRPPAWQWLRDVVADASGRVEYTDEPPPQALQRFYRAVYR